jgi:ABC-type phosphate/phosphonate transport system substrate-binding protein
MRSQGVLPLLAAVLIVVAVSACGSSASNATANGAPVGSSAMRSKLEQGILSSTAGVKAPEAKKIVDCLIGKMSAAGIKTNGEAESHQNQVTQFSTACAEKVAGAAG